MTSARLSFKDTCDDLSWRLQAVQQSLTKTKIQTGSSSGQLERLSVQSSKPKINWSLKYF